MRVKVTVATTNERDEAIGLEGTLTDETQGLDLPAVVFVGGETVRPDDLPPYAMLCIEHPADADHPLASKADAAGYNVAVTF